MDNKYATGNVAKVNFGLWTLRLECVCKGCGIGFKFMKRKKKYLKYFIQFN
jgi:hypothetical protein